jgi:hypothetical protein
MAPAPPNRKVIRGTSAAISFGVYADLAYNLYSATNSSPQTTELFAGEREVTLWKYVVIGHVQAVALGLFGSILDRSIWPLFGTLTIGGVMHGMYRHAVKAGKSQARPTVNAAPVTAEPSVTPMRKRSA